MHKILVVAGDSRSLLNFRLELLERFVDQGLSVAVCAPVDNNTPQLIETLEKLNIKVIPLRIQNSSKNIVFDLLTFVDLAKIIRSNKIDTVFCYHIKPVIYGSLVAYVMGVKNIYSMITGLGYIFTEDESNTLSWARGILKKLLTFSLSLNKKIFFQNKDDIKFVCKTEALKSRSILINGSGVNIKRFKLTQIPDSLSFVFVGRLLLHKGIHEYVAAAKILKKKYPNVIFKVAGGIHSNPSAISETQLRQWVEEGTIDYLGDVPDILPVLQNSSVCVLPSYREGCPRSLLEAMAVGRAIVTTDAPGCRDTVIEGENGYLVPVKNSAQLAQAMEKLIQNPLLVNEMGQKSRSLAEEKYDVHKVNQVILEGMGLGEDKKLSGF